MKLDIKYSYGHFLGRRNADQSVPKILSKAFVIAALPGGGKLKGFHQRVVLDLQQCSRDQNLGSCLRLHFTTSV